MKIGFQQNLCDALPSLVQFNTGQPLGLYSSWPVFALSHHILIWLAAEQVYPQVPIFSNYAVLGDDVVIADENVAIRYKELLGDLGVSISFAKSLVSHSGAAE